MCTERRKWCELFDEYIYDEEIELFCTECESGCDEEIEEGQIEVDLHDY